MTPTTATSHSSAWTITGLFWDSNHPALIASSAGQPDRRQVLVPGMELRLRLDVPRACVGVWEARTAQRIPCAASVAPGGTGAQCPRCAARDRGRALARDAHTDDRDYVLYLAWFGAGLLKVGLTAAERGHARLLEQGALAYTLLAHGSLPVIRAAEKATAAAGLAVERLRTTTKTAAWWTIPSVEERRAAVAAAWEAVEQAGMLANADPLDAQVHDNVDRFALGQPPPETYQVLTGLATPAVLAVRIRAVPGRLLLAEDLTTGTHLLIDTRLLAGYRATAPTGPTSGLHTTLRTRPPGDHHEQPGLF